jgi:hypothetical protein
MTGLVDIRIRPPPPLLSTHCRRQLILLWHKFCSLDQISDCVWEGGGEGVEEVIS